VATNDTGPGTGIATITKDDAFDEVVKTAAYDKAKHRGPVCARPLEDWYECKADLIQRLLATSPSQRRAMQQADKENRKVFLFRLVVPSAPPAPSPKGALELPWEWIAVYAFGLFEQRGYVHGFDRQDWFNAKADLLERFGPLYYHTQCDSAYWAKFAGLPVSTAWSLMDGFSADMDISTMLPGYSPPPRKDSTMRPTIRIRAVTPEECQSAERNRDPLELLSDADRRKYSGQSVAVTITGERRAEVIASAPTRDQLEHQLAANCNFAELDCAFCEVPG
jgi:hypothetical protein